MLRREITTPLADCLANTLSAQESVLLAYELLLRAGIAPQTFYYYTPTDFEEGGSRILEGLEDTSEFFRSADTRVLNDHLTDREETALRRHINEQFRYMVRHRKIPNKVAETVQEQDEQEEDRDGLAEPPALGPMLEVPLPRAAPVRVDDIAPQRRWFLGIENDLRAPARGTERR